MIENVITEGTQIGIKIYLSIASTSKPPMSNLRKALKKAASEASMKISFGEGVKIAIGSEEKIKKCTKAAFFSVNGKAAHNKYSMRDLEPIVTELLKLKPVLIPHVEGARVAKVTTEETGYEIVTLQKAKAS